MELVTDALKHDDWSALLKSILDPPETVELTYEEQEVGGDGDGDGDVVLFEWTILYFLSILVKLQLLHCC
ncbi:hypothetical protein Hanom_Chr09g00784011 [Helianthus anomalus]